MGKLGDMPAKFQIGVDVAVIKNDLYDPDFVIKLNVIPVLKSPFSK